VLTNPSKTTYYIVPAMTEIAGQCRIVAFPDAVDNARDAYRRNPDVWKDAGVMNSRGSLVALDAPTHVIHEFRSCEPLAAGLTFVLEE
jgi:hypothetical protein